MAEHVAEDLNLDRLAAQVGLSKFHFHRRFKRATGLSSGRYHINLRMNVARQSFFCCAPIRGFKQYRDRSSKNTGDGQLIAKQNHSDAQDGSSKMRTLERLEKFRRADSAAWE